MAPHDSFARAGEPAPRRRPGAAAEVFRRFAGRLIALVAEARCPAPPASWTRKTSSSRSTAVLPRLPGRAVRPRHLGCAAEPADGRYGQEMFESGQIL